MTDGKKASVVIGSLFLYFITLYSGLLGMKTLKVSRAVWLSL